MNVSFIVAHLAHLDVTYLRFHIAIFLTGKDQQVEPPSMFFFG
jgi:hypothetical protein